MPFYELTPLRWSMDSWWHWAVMFVVNDFFFYWSHRASHESRLMWASHAVHHNSDKLNLSTGMRNSWVGAAIDWVFFVPVVLLGFHPSSCSRWCPLASGWDYLTHTPYVGRLPGSTSLQHAVEPPRAPRACLGLHVREPRRRADHLGPPVRHLSRPSDRPRTASSRCRAPARPALPRVLPGGGWFRDASSRCATRPRASGRDRA